jgi:hypothetical protein
MDGVTPAPTSFMNGRTTTAIARSPAYGGQVDYNAQPLIEDPGTGVSGPNTYANAALCLSNSRLAATTYNYSVETPGIAGYEEYMSCVKQEVISGHQVTIIRICNNHSPTDPAYYPDDVVYFDDHGNYTLSGDKFTSNPAIPPGAGSDSTGCTPYVYGYTLGWLANTRAGANGKNAQAYSISIPGDRTTETYTGGTGYDTVPLRGASQLRVLRRWPRRSNFGDAAGGADHRRLHFSGPSLRPPTR